MEIKYLQVLVMPNNEILCEGKTIGFVDKLGKYLVDEGGKQLGKQIKEQDVFPAVNVMREDVEHFIGKKALAINDEDMKDIARVLGDFLSEEYHPCLEATLEKLNYINNHEK